MQNSPLWYTAFTNIHEPKGQAMAKLKLRKATSASTKSTRAKGSGGKKSKARAQGGKAQGGTPNSGQSSGSANSDLPDF